MKNVFGGFTNLYSLTKTLRFELKPTSKTQKLMKRNNVIQTDEEIDKLYHDEMKPILDEIHRRFINDALAQKIFISASLDNFLKVVKNYKVESAKKNIKQNQVKLLQKEITIKTLGLRREVVSGFITVSKKWKDKYVGLGIKLKGDGYKVLTEQAVLDILKIEFPNKAKYIDKFRGFWTYFSGFNENRKNYYSEEDKATSIANRIVNENLSRYIDNIIAFEEILQKIPNLKKFKQDLDITSYNYYLNQAGIDKYNKIIGGYIVDKDKKIQGINEKVNLYTQQTKKKLPKLKFLFKQIGSERKGFGIFEIKEGKEWEQLGDLFKLQRTKINSNGREKGLFDSLRTMYREFFDEIKRDSNSQARYSLDKIYFNKASVNTISNSWFTNWNKFAELLNIKEDKKNGEKKIPEQISIEDIKDSLSIIPKENLEELFKLTNREKHDRTRFFGSNAWVTFLNIWQNEIEESFNKLEEKEKDFKKNAAIKFQKNNLVQKNYIKEVCDRMLAIERMAKYHLPKDSNLSREEDFYWIIDNLSEQREIYKYYNAFRNYISKKPYNKSKMKLNFENGNLLGGWSDGQERNKAGVILRNGNKYYLGVLINRGIFRTDKINNEIYRTGSSKWERLILSNLKFQTLAGKGFLGKHGVSYGNMNPEKSVPSLQKFIRENYLKKYPQLTEVSNTKFLSKKDFDAAIKEALKECFTMNFINIAENKLLEAEDKGDLYLFEITNKDFSGKKSGKDNIHTIYWKYLFSESNCKSPIIGLNGGAEIFFREGQKDKLHTKLDKKGKKVFDAKSYSEDKLFFHVSITINYGKPKNIKFRDIINQLITSMNVNIIGIDRGEKHLLYYSVIDSNGIILKQGSLNKIRVGDKEVDFNKKLTERANEMKKARQSWEQIGNIKNFKEGYLSQAIHEIYQLMIKYNAIIVLEDLNTEFKAKRLSKVEKSVYKKFELKLARKLNHLILKDRNTNEIGGVLKAYQLTPTIGGGDVSKFEKAKQWGMMFYVRANYTSTTDPVTGWRKHLYISNFSNNSVIKSFFDPTNRDTGIEIFYSGKYRSWGFRYVQKETGKKWELFATKELERFKYNQTTKLCEKINLYDKFEELFKGIDKSADIYSQLCNVLDFRWKSLVYLWNLLNQIRNVDKNAEGNKNDFIQSPVYPFFDSRKTDGKTEPINGDANGALNIARKGLMLVERIKNNPEKYEQLIRDTEWDAWIQNFNKVN